MGRKKGMVPFAGIIIIRETDRDVSREKNSKDNSCSTKIFRSSEWERRIFLQLIGRKGFIHPRRVITGLVFGETWPENLEEMLLMISMEIEVIFRSFVLN